MKEWGLLIWIPQFAISVAFPLIVFVWLAVWLYDERGWGSWVIWVGILFGLITAAIGFRDTAKAMLQSSGHDGKKQNPGASFNEHL